MKIFITGGSGSLGKTLARHYVEQGDSVIVFSRDEGKQAAMRTIFDENELSKISFVIGDIRDYDKVSMAMMIHKPDVVIHAAALKRIDDMERFPEECVKTNILGSENIAKAALNNKVGKCVLVSTDKACKPVNVYGAAKFTAERIFSNYNNFSTVTRFFAVRYGNVIASRGSFVPLWIGQLKQGKEITLTSGDCGRFLFTLKDAASFVTKVINVAVGGEVFVPFLKSYTMQHAVEVVFDIVGVSDCTIRYVGMRPGEKLHEDMLSDVELSNTRMIQVGQGSQEVLVILPQYSSRSYSNYPRAYQGKEMNTEFHISEDSEELKTLIERGINEAK